MTKLLLVLIITVSYSNTYAQQRLKTALGKCMKKTLDSKYELHTKNGIRTHVEFLLSGTFLFYDSDHIVIVNERQEKIKYRWDVARDPMADGDYLILSDPDTYQRLRAFLWKEVTWSDNETVLKFNDKDWSSDGTIILILKETDIGN